MLLLFSLQNTFELLCTEQLSSEDMAGIYLE